MLSVKEIDKIFDNPKTKLVGDIIGNPWLCYAKVDIQEIRAQALVYVSLVEKIKEIVPESEYIVERVRELKSFIGES